MDELSMTARTMPLREIIAEFEATYSPDHQDAYDAAVVILTALQEAGVNDAEQVADLLHDYNGIAEQYRAMRTRYEVPRKPFHADGVWHCPRCNKRVGFNNTHCHWCGQKIKWG